MYLVIGATAYFGRQAVEELATRSGVDGAGAHPYPGKGRPSGLG